MKRKGTQRVPAAPRPDFDLLIDSAKAKTDLVRALGNVPSSTKRTGRTVSANVTGQKEINIVGAAARGASNVLKGKDASGANKSIRPPAKRKK